MDDKYITWNVNEGKKIKENNIENNEITCISHPKTYLDKILIGTNKGYIDLYNFRVGKKIYRFGPFLKNNSNWLNEIQKNEQVLPIITCIEISDILDVIAIGFNDGRVIIHNIKIDKTLFSFNNTSFYYLI
jgi:U3 small nucleolar RNA-associated protein 21